MGGDTGTIADSAESRRVRPTPEAPGVGGLVFVVGCLRGFGALAGTLLAVARAAGPDPIDLEPQILRRS